MRLILLGFTAVVTLTLSQVVPVRAETSGPVTWIPIYVQPYYEAAQTPDGAHMVKVGAEYDALLASNNPEDILAVRDIIEAQPEFVTPMTLMVLAIRFYDVGLRDDAVFWFYAAKNRFLTMVDVLEMRSGELAGSTTATTSFMSLAGPYINSYAFCDLDKQHAAARAAFEWVKANPYEAIYLEQLPALPGDRGENMNKQVEKIAESIQKEWTYLSDTENWIEFVERRKVNNADKQFCWTE